MSVQTVRNIGISAHIDSGKTTLSERILFYAGKIHRMGEVKDRHGGNATMDDTPLEIEKGITIQSAATSVHWAGHTIHLIDTPGHVDFTIEVERALRVLDGAVLVLCGVAGVQSQSYTVDRQMRRYKVPRIAFVNKLDRSGANPFRVVDQLREKLRLTPILMQIPIGLEDRFEGVVDLLTQRAFYFEGEHGEDVREADIPADLVPEAVAWRAKLVEAAAEVDDALTEQYLQDEDIPIPDIVAGLRRATIALKAVPVFVGSAYKNKGVQLLLDGVVSYLPNPADVVNVALNQEQAEAEVRLHADPTLPFVGLAFKLEERPFGQLTYVRVYQGSLNKSDIIYNGTSGQRSKVSRLVQMHASEMIDITTAEAGDIVALLGIDCATGDTFTDGSVNYTLTSMHVPDPVVSLAVSPKDHEGQAHFSKALNRFSKEDPTFRVHRDEESAETIISGMGELHLEIYIERMRREYDCEVTFGQPQVKYRETITQTAEFDYTHSKQTGGRGQFARVAGRVEPCTKDYEFGDEVVGGTIPREFISAVDKGFKEALVRGPLLGCPIVGVRAVVADGKAHAVDSSDLAFRQAALMGFRAGYLAAAPTVLEPVMLVEVIVPSEFQGAVIGHVNQRRGAVTSSEKMDEAVSRVLAEVPLSTMFGYSSTLRSATQGKGEFSMEFARYTEIPRNVRDGLIADYKRKS